MMARSFTLVPFPDPNIPEINLTGRIARENNILTIDYLLAGFIGPIRFPEPVPHPDRREELWLATCFEFFLAVSNRPQYWEFNLSPSGEWNVFCMDGYRRIGFRQEDRIQNLHLDITNNSDCFYLTTAVDLMPIIEPGPQIEAGITSVIQTRDGHESYWALTHPSPQADFHLRESFICLL